MRVRGDEGWDRVLEGTKVRPQQPTVPTECGDRGVSQVAETMECNPWVQTTGHAWSIKERGWGVAGHGAGLLVEPSFEDPAFFRSSEGCTVRQAACAVGGAAAETLRVVK